MKKFFINLTLFVCFTIILSICISIYYIYKYKLDYIDIPPPNFSSSISFNEKMLFLHGYNTHPSVISIGSSMSLNNLKSSVIVEKMKTNAYLNTASWGMQMKDNFFTLKIFASIYPIHSIILCSSIADFQPKEKNIKYDQINNYLKPNNNALLTFLETFNLKYFLDNIRSIRFYRTVKNYAYLNFDKYGSIQLDSSNFKISKSRWLISYLQQQPSVEQYTYLDSIAKYCQNKNIALILFQAPMRKGLYSSLSVEDKLTLNTHIERVQLILDKYNVPHINSLDTTWDDHLFIDGTHLNTEGATIFTNYCFDKLNQSKRTTH